MPAALREVLTRRDQIAEIAPAPRPVEALLGHRRQRPEQGGRRRGADQAQRALLQVDGLRLHGGQEAHRPVVRAADPRVRRGPRGVDRRRRRQGSRHLPGPQGDADRRRQRRRRRASRPTSRSACPAVDPALGFVLSAMVGHLFGYEAALAIDASAHPLREAREAVEHLVGAGPVGRRGRRAG